MGLYDAISEKLGNLIHYMTQLYLGFITMWQLVLFTLAVVPLLQTALSRHHGTGKLSFKSEDAISKARQQHWQAGDGGDADTHRAIVH
jgi:hypothetical protein